MQGLTGSPDRGQGAHGPLRGSGQSPEVWPLTVRAAPLSSNERQHLTLISQVRQRHQSSRSELFRAAHTPQHIARFRKSGKRRFPDFRREADAQQKRWEAKRSRTLPLTQKTGADGKVKGLTVKNIPTASGIFRERLAAQRLRRRPAALRDLGNP